MSAAKTGWKQDFFEKVPPIKMTDPLASALGATEDGGVIEYRFEDCVKVAGHACASVACAFMLTKKALEALYPGAVPERGNVQVRYAGGRTDGANGPIGQVIGFITGAATDTGFHGLGGKYGRDNLFIYDETMDQNPASITVQFRRMDTGATVTARATPSLVPLSPEEREGANHMPAAIQGRATAEQRERFFAFWQGRNRRILLEDHAGVFEVVKG